MYEQFFAVATSKVASQAPKVVSVMSQAWAEGKSSGWAINQLKGLGLSYKRTNMLQDFRRAGSISRVAEGNTQGLLKAHKYFENIIEPFRKAEGLTMKQAFDKLHKWEKMQYDTEEQARELEEAGSKYNFEYTP